MAEETKSAGSVGHEEHHEPNYIAVFLWLGALTILEIGVSKLALPRGTMIAMLVGLAFLKASLVALYFMHLISEKQLLKLIVIVPVIVASILLAGLIPDALHKLFGR